MSDESTEKMPGTLMQKKKEKSAKQLKYEAWQRSQQIAKTIRSREQKLWELYKQCANGLVYATDLENSAMLDLQTAAVLLKVWEAGAGEILNNNKTNKGETK